MVTVTNYTVATNSEGKSFVILELQGDLEMVQSQNSGKFYATARKCGITSTFDESTAAQLVGRQLPGSILKEACEPYEYTVPETGEQITLSHRYGYSPTEPQPVVSQPKLEPVVPNLSNFSTNGKNVFAQA